jgi:hypothetical protein
VTGAVSTATGTRRVQGTIDLLIEASDGVVIIDHKSFPGGVSQLCDKALEFAPQLAAYAHVLTAAGLQVTAMYVHFPLGAYVARLRQAAFDTLGANNGRRRLNPTRGIQ